jgi:hypothetical protein
MTRKLGTLLKRHWKPLVGVVLGAGVGAAYSRYVGCYVGG